MRRSRRTSATFGDPARLKQLALDEATDFVGVMRLWWSKGKGNKLEERPFSKIPSPVILLEFYRSQAQRKRVLEERGKLGKLAHEDLQELADVRALFAPSSPPPSLLRLVESGGMVRGPSGDPIWDRYVEAIRTGDIPDEWWGPMLPKIKAKKAAATR